MKLTKIKRLAEAQPRNQSRNKNELKKKKISFIPVISVKETEVKDEFEVQLEKAIRMFYEISKYVKPACFGFRYAFPDGDEICQNCPLYKLNETDKEIIGYAKFLQEKYKDTEEIALEKALIIHSCKFASDEKLRHHYLILKEKEESIRQRFENDQFIEERIRRVQEPFILEFEREKKNAVDSRKKKIEELMKGG